MTGSGRSEPIDIREQRRAATRAAIADEAMAMLLEGGIGSVSINRLARRVGYTPGALYSYFASRDALLAELQFRVFQQFRDDFVEIERHLLDVMTVQPAPVSQFMLLLLLVPDILDALARRHPEPYRFLSEIAADPRELINDQEARRVWPAVEPIVTSLLTAFSEASAAAELSAGNAVARLVVYLSALQGQMQARKVLRFFPQAESAPLLYEAADALLAGWGADADVLKSGRDWLRAHPELLQVSAAG